jgi:sulfur-carrier protein
VTTVRIPRSMQVYAHDMEVVRAGGKNVRALINNLEKNFPGLKNALMKEEKLKPGLAIMVDGEISRLGVLQPLSEDNEVVFIPAISGG